MQDRTGTTRRMWEIYKKGGITPAFASMLGSSNAHQMAFIRSAMKVQRQKSLFEMPLASLEAVVFDLETTGFNPHNGDEILSFGAAAVVGNQLVEDEQFYSLSNPGKPVSEEITSLTGITTEMASDAPELIEALHRFFEFVQKRILVAHAAGHDKPFLNAALWKTSKVSLTHRVLDTMMIAKWLHPSLAAYDLDALLNLYDIPIEGRHHALKDSIMTAKLWVRMVERILDRNVTTVGDLYMYLSKH